MIRLKVLFRACNVFTSLVITAISASDSISADVVTFGSGANQFTMEFTTIGSPGNANDTTGNPNPAGGVSYTYQLGTYEVSEEMITKFNASQSLQITKGSRGVDKPATHVSWNEAARFVNWLNTSHGYQAAYNFTTGGVNDNIALWSSAAAWQLDGQNLFRNANAHFWLPSMNEWYKAAFYNPVTNSYGDYATANGLVPTSVASGTTANTAVYNQSDPADITLAGGLSAFGVMGLNGNVWEWEETSADLSNSLVSSNRGYRGGSWYDASPHLSSSARGVDGLPALSPSDIGFRVARLSSSAAAVPEPASWVLSVMGLSVCWYRRRRRP